MGLDIRLPLGCLFSITGFLLLGYGFLTRGNAMYTASLGVNLNLAWGGVMLVFGLLMLWFGRPKRKV
jgi:hypothetical protein